MTRSPEGMYVMVQQWKTTDHSGVERDVAYNFFVDPAEPMMVWSYLGDDDGRIVLGAVEEFLKIDAVHNTMTFLEFGTSAALDFDVAQAYKRALNEQVEYSNDMGFVTYE